MTAESADTQETGRFATKGAGRTTQAPLPPPRAATPASPHRGVTPRGSGAAGPLAVDCLATIAALSVVTAYGEVGRALLALGPGLLTVVVLNAHAGLYRASPAATALEELPALLIRSALAWAVAASVLAAADPTHGLGYAALLSLLLLHTAVACVGRAVVYLARRSAARRRPRSTLVVGLGPMCTQVTAALYAHPEYGMRPVGLVGTEQDGRNHQDAEPSPEHAPLPVLRAAEDISRAVIQNSVRDAVLTRDPSEERGLGALARHLDALGCAVWFVRSQPAEGSLERSAAVGHLWGFTCHRFPRPAPRRVEVLAKRTMDLLGASVALLAVSPVLLVCAVAVRLADGPGVLFRQERLGQDGKPFVVLKFRTLRPSNAYESATRWSVADDRRVSAVGRLLRRTSLDELPQLWNVLRGDMSLVGPRPERPYFVGQFSKRYTYYGARHRMPVGITGLAQVHGLRGDTSIEDRARFDNHYIDTWSPWRDVCILLRTVTSLFRPGGS